MIINCLHQLFVETEDFRNHLGIDKKLACQIEVALFERIQQQRIYVIARGQRHEMMKIKIQLADFIAVVNIDILLILKYGM